MLLSVPYGVGDVFTVVCLVERLNQFAVEPAILDFSWLQPVHLDSELPAFQVRHPTRAEDVPFHAQNSFISGVLTALDLRQPRREAGPGLWGAVIGSS